MIVIKIKNIHKKQKKHLPLKKKLYINLSRGRPDSSVGRAED